ncbi:MAG: hypothetical protein DHS20C21_08350 [Gemmatimonadota bacterium]|nr:MAG: hypothetical protein DHS20C21_08350 [Gemmatimonadota bacterium]
MKRTHRTTAPLCLALLAITAVPAFAENPESIFKKVTEHYERRLASIESVTIVQDVLGMETTTHLRKEVVDGHPALVAAGPGQGSDFHSMYRSLNEMAKSSTLKGSQDVDGHACWVVHVKDLGGLDMGAEGSEDFEASDGELCIDKKSFVLRRMQMNGETNADGVKSPITMEMQLTDYREVDGWLHPFRTQMSLGEPEGKASPQMAEMREAMEKMKAEMAQMPEDQRRMMEQMMKSKMPDFEKMTEGGKMTMTIQVKELKVNQPEG